MNIFKLSHMGNRFHQYFIHEMFFGHWWYRRGSFWWLKMIELLASDMQISQMAVEIGNLADMTNPVSHSNRFSISGFSGCSSFPILLKPPGSEELPRKPFAANSSWRCGPMMMPASPSRVAVPCRFWNGEMGWSHWGLRSVGNHGELRRFPLSEKTEVWHRHIE